MPRRQVIKFGLAAGAALLAGDTTPVRREVIVMPEGPRHHHHHHQPPPTPPPPPVIPPPPNPSAANFYDDFSGIAAGSLPSASNWVISQLSYNDDPTDGSANYTSSPQNVYVNSSSQLVLAVTAVAGGKTVKPSRGAYNSARIGTFDTMNGGNVKFAQSWGTWSASIQITPAQGWWPAFWTTGTNITSWPYCGEIDIMENFGSEGGNLYQAYANVNGPMGNGDNYGYGDDEQLATPQTIETGFHVYSAAIPEDYSEISFAYDGVTYATVTQQEWLSKAGSGATWPYSAATPQGFILNVDVGSDVDPAGVGYPAASQVLPANVLVVDWVQATQP
jgi:beta-glucanase (GH16 family)